MPEGPSIVILKEAINSFRGKKILEADGYGKDLAYGRLHGTKIKDIKTFGKHLLICFPDFTIRVHLLMFGSYRINNDKKDRNPKLRLHFSDGQTLSFYAGSIVMIDEPLDDLYDWSADVMNPNFSAGKALKKLNAHPKTIVSDALLDQTIFAGSGNIIKNEVLFRVKVHPKSKVGKIPATFLRKMIRETVRYSFQFLEWKKAGTLRKHWEVYTKQVCPRDGHKIKKQYLGKGKRRSFFCPDCQLLY
ncbi:MAG TPA: DNA-formamidopyrimidine glycosylase family protein [Cyclobacteriaceae bacterium]|nr:endonuclease [Cyclobacteriaceae bacterium]HMV11190.1 DNA-formamidopyrimidine glycosylase family protein [Cyclobacteriaceae bacterium]HMV91633.1 DNA-formamidopyrimidine glycosylase family protein [Cyclobacteriaceae bacterium]HMX01718.1 DNA-formamidopyrimidine glycosylase family protein [Cyclobacteriaceae bacterium]HMX51395.1 DNA-formamidopyrimidine glycosylase family protein [Cyclobacteriaceae bacterium]